MPRVAATIPSMKAKELTPRQERFIQEYLHDLNATQAAIRAKFSKKTAAQTAARLLRNVKVSARIEALKAERAAELKLTNKLVLRRLREEGDYKGPGSSHAARVRAWELIAKHRGFFPREQKL